MFKEIYNINNCINLTPVKRSEEEALLVAKEVDSTIYSAKSETSWHLINGKYYRFKFFNRFYHVLNELIGPKIAHKLELRTANNLPAVMHYSEKLKFYGIVSENFKELNKKYLTMFDLGFRNTTTPNYKNMKKLKKYCNEEDYYELINNLFKMTCLDYVMGQADRVASNFLFEKDGDKITFAPLFDYAEAYECIKPGCYFNPRENIALSCSVGNSLIILAFWEPEFQKILKKYPRFLKYLEKISEIDIIEILEELEEEYKIKITDEQKDYYDVRTKEKQKVLIF